MNTSSFGSLLLFFGCASLAFAAYVYFIVGGPLNHENCGVTIVAKDPIAAQKIKAIAEGARIPLRLINTSGKPVRIVGNNAC